MKLFREYKDPTILVAQFQPLYKRLVFLFEVSDDSKDEQLVRDSGQLIKFVSFLEMGKFYSDELRELISALPRVFVDGTPPQQYERLFREQLERNRTKALDLVIELLRYQNWNDEKRNHA